ncbi:hypothetical protein ACET3Z_003417 [Daucus carota]
MNCIDIKVEKANAMLRLSTHLPLALKVSADCIHSLYITIFSPAFLFILGNAIVLVLLFNSGHLSVQETKISSHTIEFCTQYVESCVIRVEELEKQGEEAVSDMCSSSEDGKMLRRQSESLMRYQHRDFGKKLGPTLTENGRKTRNNDERALESPAMIGKSGHHRVSAQKFSPKCYAEDEMSGEEFRHAVEAFIARQQKFLREEFSSIVAYGN